MDKEVLDQRLGQLCQQAMQEAKAAVAQAPDGAWIAASEWPIRHIFQKLTRDCYQLLMQVRIEEHDAAREAAFSPCGRRVAAGQRAARPAVPDRRR